MLVGVDDISCRLDAEQRPRQASAWAELAPLALERHAEPGRLSVVFDLQAGPRLQQLIDIERECCAWAQWQLDGTRLEVAGPPDAIAALGQVLLPGPSGLSG
jgi:hypothetical protein